MLKPIIKPTIGRKLWYWRRDPAVLPPETQPEDATVVYVWSDTNVNLRVTNHDGLSRSETSIQILAEGEPHPDHGHAEWMPFQVGQAKATENVGAIPETNKVPLKP